MSKHIFHLRDSVIIEADSHYINIGVREVFIIANGKQPETHIMLRNVLYYEVMGD